MGSQLYADSYMSLTALVLLGRIIPQPFIIKCYCCRRFHSLMCRQSDRREYRRSLVALRGRVITSNARLMNRSGVASKIRADPSWLAVATLVPSGLKAMASCCQIVGRSRVVVICLRPPPSESVIIGVAPQVGLTERTIPSISGGLRKAFTATSERAGQRISMRSRNALISALCG